MGLRGRYCHFVLFFWISGQLLNPAMADEGSSWQKLQGLEEEIATPTLTEVMVYGERSSIEKRKHSATANIVVGADEMQRYNSQTIGEVLCRQTGMFLGGPPGEAKDLRMRGLDKEYTQVLIDGEPMPGGGEKREFQLDLMPASMVERIEILRGPSAEFEGQGIAGTVNIVLKKAAKKREARYIVGVSKAESECWGENLTLIYGNSLGDFSYLLNGNVQTRSAIKEKSLAGQNAAGVPDKFEYEDEVKEYTDYNLAPRFSWQLNDRDTFEFAPTLLRSDENKTKDKLKLTGLAAFNGLETEAENNLRNTWGLNMDWKRTRVLRV